MPVAHPRRRATLILLALLLLGMASFLLASCYGSVSLTLVDWQAGVRQMLSGGRGAAGAPDLNATLLGLRLARAWQAFVVGGSLALAGVMMQALLRNPLADPYILGVSSGAAVGALAAMLFSSALLLIDAAALAGALAISLLLYGLARRDLQNGGNGVGSGSLLLTGVVLSSACMALVTLMLSLAPDASLRGMVFWMIGDLSGSEWHALPTLALAIALLVACHLARAVNVLALHFDNAAALGVPVARLCQALFGLAALLTAIAVSSAGSIGFVGLIVPHACRMALGPDHRLLMPASVLVGGIFLLLADTLARSVVAPLQLPVGVVTSLIGVPIFLLQLHRIRRAA
jgi:iron complex transport system permease protein